MLAIDVSNIYAVHRLLSKGADPNATDISRHRPLNYATQKHDTYLIDLLLVHGADPDPTDQHAR
jgi:ankyrin repeat protein